MTSTLNKSTHWLLSDTAPFTPEDFDNTTRSIAELTQQFVDRELMPRMAELESKPDGLNARLLRQVAELGFFQTEVAEDEGGLDLPKVSSTIISEKLGGTGGFGVTFGGQAGIGLLPLVYFGTPAQKAKYLEKLMSAEWIAAYALTEPGSGSDAMGARTTAVLSDDGSHYVLNGSKMWITNAGIADLFTVFAQIRTPEGNKFSTFLIERGFPGVRVGREEHKMGLHSSSTCAVFFEDAQIPAENLLGQPGDGAKIAFNILNIGRYKLGAGGVGAAKAALAVALAYAQERQQFGQPISHFGAVRKKLANISAEIYAVESAVYRTVGSIDAAVAGGQDKLGAIEAHAAEASMVKVLGTELLDYAVDEGVQIHGGYGFSGEYDIERQYRDSRVQRIFEGTNEINRLLIPLRTLSGLPAEALAVQDAGDDVAQVIGDMRALSVGLLRQAAENYGKGLRQEQAVVLRLADLLMLTYAATSAQGRTLKLGSPADAVARTRLYVARAAGRFAQTVAELKHVLELSADQRAGLARLASGPLDVIAAQGAVADLLIKH
ncbi:acyl-CoA dehydrogenase family protein [Deinococcus sp.]|uniref:acyl-CoA dehydrogenase family protein n=1 Tax=Deinococcus sp. TaxID=47478 RepID=UPI0025BA3467|nr:acyl-CoA dehydrogenase family protein [Deinococcus sp.]